jgi:hypothetical protein
MKKRERIEFLVLDPAICKIVVDHKRLNKLNNFKNLGCEISYENGKFIQQKLANFCSNTGKSKETFNLNLVQEFSTMKVYNALDIPIILHGREIWTRRKEDEKDCYQSIRKARA